MDKLNSVEALSSAWRALGASTRREGWRTIPIAVRTSCHVLAGRQFPGNQEAILVGFNSSDIPAVTHLPESNGFAVRVFDLALGSRNRVWFGLVRQANGNLEMFTMMASDIIRTVDVPDIHSDAQLFNLFLGRIRAWQGFMQRSTDGVLSPQEEVGLHGELVVLNSILRSIADASISIESWVGPLDGVQDFQLGTGAIEVKSTASKSSFIATVSSLEQLNDDLTKPLFLAGVRLRLDQVGLNLPARVEMIRNSLKSNPATLALFEIKLLHAGFFQSMETQYARRFTHDSTNVFVIDERFPRLVENNVPNGIRSVRYEIDLESISSTPVSMRTILRMLGVIS